MCRSMIIFGLLASLAGCSGSGSDSTPDAGAAAQADAGPSCDPLAGTGCSLSQKCIFHESALACVDLGTKGDYQSCGSAAECAAGFSCFNYPGAVELSCIHYCRKDADCPQATIKEACTLVLDGTDLRACERICDPLLQNCPDSRTACYLTNGSTTCASVGSKAVGDPCTATNECGRGSSCLSRSGGAFTCKQICDPAALAPDAGASAPDGGPIGPIGACPASLACVPLSGSSAGTCG